VRTDRVRTAKKQVCEKWTLTKPRLNSLFLRNNSLILKIFSLLICVGNCARSRCRRAVSCYGIPPQTPKIAIFPVKFPVSRELAWRLVRSALRRQPASGSTGDCYPAIPRSAGQLRLFVNSISVSILDLSAKSPIVSGLHLKYSRFWETRARDRRDQHCVVTRQYRVGRAAPILKHTTSVTSVARHFASEADPRRGGWQLVR